VTHAGTVVAVRLGALRIDLAPEEVVVDMTFSASLPLASVQRARLRAN
jgi:hypothetical protein